MIKFNDYQIRFFYTPKDRQSVKETTQCIIEKPKTGLIRLLSREDWTIVGRGTTKCSVNDHFCRDRGRRISMLRAMKDAGFSKDQRKLVWEIYRNTKIGGRWQV